MTTLHYFNFDVCDPSWQAYLKKALSKMNPAYLDALYQSTDWLPGPQKILNAFSLPLQHVKTVLIGESPYPRPHSANGYAFWDAAVTTLWSDTGLSKTVNRATSLRNFIKMLLIAEGLLDPNQTSQEAIAKIEKDSLIQTNTELFQRLLQHGFLLLNISLVLQPHQSVQKDAKAWHPFIHTIFDMLREKRPDISVLLWGNIANGIAPLVQKTLISVYQTEHPYNISFITNKTMIDFFRPLHLLKR